MNDLINNINVYQKRLKTIDDLLKLITKTSKPIKIVIPSINVSQDEVIKFENKFRRNKQECEDIRTNGKKANKSDNKIKKECAEYLRKKKRYQIAKKLIGMDENKDKNAKEIEKLIDDEIKDEDFDKDADEIIKEIEDDKYGGKRYIKLIH